MTVILKTARLDLRPLTDSDYPAYKRLVTDRQIAQPAGLMGNPDEQQVQHWYRADRQAPRSYAVVCHQTNALIGVILFYSWVDDTGAPDETGLELGYFMDPDCWGQGFMTEAVAACLTDLARTGAPVTTVWANTLVSNTRSVRLLEKLAFQTIGDQLMAVTSGGQTLQRQALLRLDLNNR